MPDGLQPGSGCDNLPLANWQARPLSLEAALTRTQDALTDHRIQALYRGLVARRPRLYAGNPEVARAAVALVVRPGPDDLDILLIERPANEADPWSGHMALPGGRRDRNEDPLETAMRETLEEVGVDLRESGALIGRLDDVAPHRGGPQIAVSPFVFAVPREVAATPNPAEVAAVVWIPIRHLIDPAAAAEHLHVLPQGGHLRLPSIEYQQRVIWGLTYRMLLQFLGVARGARLEEAS